MKNIINSLAQKIEKTESIFESLNETGENATAFSNGNLAEIATKDEVNNGFKNQLLDGKADKIDANKGADYENRNNPDKKHMQSQEQNAEFARRRREKELKEKIEQAKADAVIDAFGGMNPLTNETMQTLEDVQKFLSMKNKFLDSQNSNTYIFNTKTDNKINSDDNAKEESESKNENNENLTIKTDEICKNNQELTQNKDFGLENSKKLFEAETQKREYLINHSENEYLELMKNADFLDYVSDKTSLSLENKQKEFERFVGRVEMNAKILASQILANKLASPGALRSDVSVEPSYLSRQQVEEMSSKEIHENYEKIKQSMKHWK